MFLPKRSMVVGKQEGTAYTAETLADANFDIEVEDLEFSYDVKELLQKLNDGTLDTKRSFMGKQTSTMGFRTPLVPGATVTTLPAWSKFAESCGWKAVGWDSGSEVAVGSAVHGISWVLHSDNTHVPMTLEAIQPKEGADPDQLITKISGAAGNMEISIGEVGEPIYFKFDFMGRLNSVFDRTYANILSQTGLSTVKAPEFLTSTVQVGAVENIVDKFTINPGASVQPYTYAGNGSGVKGAYIGSWEPTLNMDPLADLLANDAVYTQLLAGTQAAVTINLYSPTGVPITISAPKAQYQTVNPYGEREEAVVNEKTFRLHKDSGNDSVEILQGAKS